MRANKNKNKILGFCFFLAAACVSTETSYAARLKATDVAIYWPLKAKDPVDEIFKMQGTGRCNLPDLNLAVEKIPSSLPAVNRAQFEALATLIYGKGEDGLCNSAKDIVFEGDPTNDLTFLKRPNLKSENLSLLRGIPSRACKYENWRIVSFRYDPCLDRPGRTFKTKKDIEACVAQVRLVAQPFNSDGGFFPDDLALHLIYDIGGAERAELVKDLLALSKVTTAIETKKGGWDRFDNEVYMMRPHPGLRAEMNTCGGPMIAGVVNVLKKYTNHKKLEQMAWMSSSTTGMQWNFGFVAVKGDKVTKSSSSMSGEYDNFSAEIFNDGTGSPFNSFMTDIKKPNLLALYRPDTFMKFDDFTAQEKQKIAAMFTSVEKVANPHKVFQGGSNCFSCHIIDQTINEYSNRKISVKKSAEAYPVDVPRWPGFSVSDRAQFNFRNFGYGPSFSFGLSTRVVHEAHDAAFNLNLLYINPPQ